MVGLRVSLVMGSGVRLVMGSGVRLTCGQLVSEQAEDPLRQNAGSEQVVTVVIHCKLSLHLGEEDKRLHTLILHTQHLHQRLQKYTHPSLKYKYRYSCLKRLKLKLKY